MVTCYLPASFATLTSPGSGMVLGWGGGCVQCGGRCVHMVAAWGVWLVVLGVE